MSAYKFRTGPELHQFRHLRRVNKGNSVGRLLKELLPQTTGSFPIVHEHQYLPQRHPPENLGTLSNPCNTSQTSWWEVPTMLHELGHCMELVERGKFTRLKLENFGYMSGYLKMASVDREFLACVFQYLLEMRVKDLNPILQFPEAWGIKGSALDFYRQEHQRHNLTISELQAYKDFQDRVDAMTPKFDKTLRDLDIYLYDACQEEIGHLG